MINNDWNEICRARKANRENGRWVFSAFVDALLVVIITLICMGWGLFIEMGMGR